MGRNIRGRSETLIWDEIRIKTELKIEYTWDGRKNVSVAERESDVTADSVSSPKAAPTTIIRFISPFQ